MRTQQKSGGSRDAVPSTRSILKDQLAATEEPTFGQLRALVASGRVPLPLAIAVKLAFLAWRAEATGDQKQKIGKSVLSKVTANLPPEYRKKGKAIEKQISDDAEDVANLSPYDAVLAFFKLWRSLPASRYVWFPVKQTVQDEADAKEIWLGIGKESVCIIDGPAREIQKSYAVADLKRFAASPSQITLDFGTKGCPTYLTTEAGHMEILLAAHLEVYWRKKREAELAARQAAALLHGPASSQPDVPANVVFAAPSPSPADTDGQVLGALEDVITFLASGSAMCTEPLVSDLQNIRDFLQAQSDGSESLVADLDSLLHEVMFAGANVLDDQGRATITAACLSALSTAFGHPNMNSSSNDALLRMARLLANEMAFLAGRGVPSRGHDTVQMLKDLLLELDAGVGGSATSSLHETARAIGRAIAAMQIQLKTVPDLPHRDGRGEEPSAAGLPALHGLRTSMTATYAEDGAGDIRANAIRLAAVFNHGMASIRL